MAQQKSVDDLCFGGVAVIDLTRAANLLIKEHGKDASFVAAQRADELLEEGDIEGCRVFALIAASIRDFFQSPFNPRDVLH